MKCGKLGHTLIEILITMVIISLILTLVAQLSISSWKYLMYGTAQSDQLESARILINNLSEAVMSSDELFASSRDILTVKRTYYINGPVTKIISYKLEKNENNLFNVYRVEYPLSYNPNDLSTYIPSNKTLVAKNVTNCSVRLNSSNPKLYDISMEIVNLSPKIPKFNLATRAMRKK